MILGDKLEDAKKNPGVPASTRGYGNQPLKGLGYMTHTNAFDRFMSKVEKTETCWNWTAGHAKGGYGAFKIDGKTWQAHRVSYEMSGNAIPEGMDLDHICRNRLCVRPEHLRPTTRKENNENHGGAYKNSASGVRGVTRQKSRWRAQVRHNGKLISVGSYINIEDAEAAVIAKRLELFTHNETDRAA